jgi:hypothetical protein
MKKVLMLLVGVFFALAAACATPGGVKTSSDSSAKIEKVEFKADKSGEYYGYVTVRNVSGKEQPFYLMMQAEDQPPQITASGAKGEPKPIPAGQVYTFELNTLLKQEPKNVVIEVMEKLPR